MGRDLKEEASSESVLVTKLLALWSSGHMSATAVQELAHAALLDGLQHEEIAQLASLGATGAWMGNVGRDLMRRVSKDVPLPEPTMLSVPCMDPVSGEYSLEQCGVFLPHEMFGKLMAYYEDSESIFEAARGPWFWRNVKGQDPKLQDNPMLAVQEWQNKFIPCYIHGDGVQYENDDSLMVFSWGSLLSEAPSMDSSIFLAAWPKSCTVKGSENQLGTWDVLMKVLCWSFESLFAGVHPLLDWEGTQWPVGSHQQELAGTPLTSSGKRVAVWSLLGDMEYFVNMLRMPHWSSSAWCWLDNSHSTDPQRDWREFRPGRSGWVYRTIEEELQQRKSPHPFFRLPGVTCFSIALDALHVLYCKGVYSHVFGSLLHTLVWPSGKRPAEGPQARLAALFREIQDLYKHFEVPYRLNSLRFSMFCDPSAPHASHPALSAKAAESKALLPIMHILARRHHEGSMHDNQREACLEALLEYQRCIDSAGMFLTDAEASRSKWWMQKALVHYSWLNKWALQHERKLWHLTPKFHWALHMSEQAATLNPRAVWTFRSEDYVGKISVICHSCTFGTRRSAQAHKLCNKYRCNLHLRLTRGDFQD